MNTIDAALRDGAELTAWAEPNSVVLADDRMNNAVLGSLGGPMPPELACGTPLLRFANVHLPAIPLVQAVMNQPHHTPTACDRCGTDQRSILDRLWVPAGASVVEVAVCWRCKVDLDMPHRGGSSLVWN